MPIESNLRNTLVVMKTLPLKCFPKRYFVVIMVTRNQYQYNGKEEVIAAILTLG